MKTALAFLLFYSLILTLILYGVGSQYDISDALVLELPDEPDPSDVFGRIWYGFNMLWSYVTVVFNIPMTAYNTIALIGAEHPELTVFIMLPALISMLSIVVWVISTIRGSGAS